MKMTFNKKFKKAFNEEFNYSNPEFEAQIKVEKQTKSYKPKLSYSIKLVLSTMILTLCVSILGFRLWLGDKSKTTDDDIREKIAEELNAVYIDYIGKYECRFFAVDLYQYHTSDEKLDVCLNFNSLGNVDRYSEVKILININEITNEIVLPNVDKIVPFNIANQYGDLSIKIFLNDNLQLNFTQEIENRNKI